MTIDIASDGNSAFVDIFGDIISARITIYKDGRDDCEIFSEGDIYSYNNITNLRNQQKVSKTMLEIIEKVRRYRTDKPSH